jgi:hypothetical protein
VASFAPINEEISVRREDLALVREFGHSHNTRIRKTHRLITVFPQQPKYVRAVLTYGEVQPDQTTFDQRQNWLQIGAHGLQAKNGFRQHGLTCPKRIIESFPTTYRPLMILVRAI